MKKICTLILLSLLFFKCAIAQTSTSCNAEFSWQYLGSNVIRFNPLLTADTVTAHHYWIFGDGDSATTVAPTHTYLIPDSFKVKHYVYRTNLDGTVECRDSFTRVIQIASCNIHASYTWAADSNNTRKIIFTNKTITPIPDASAIWFFGDGTSDTGWNTLHEYSQPGRYYVCLRIQSNTSCRSYSCDSITVSSLSSCNIHAGYTWAADSNNTRKIIFTNKTITPTTDASAIWFFGDGTDGTGWNTSHEYSMPGKYYVCLRIQTNTSCRSYSCDSITVSSLSSCNIHASYTWAADSNNTRKIIFTNKTITPTPDASAVWFFGDGTDGTGWNTSHEYSMPGRYYVCLRIQTNTSCRSYSCDSITVSSLSSCNIHASYTWAADSNNTRKIIFTNKTITPPPDASAVWFFGDGTDGTGWNTSHEYSMPGRYYVCLRIQTNTSCRSYSCDSITVSSLSSCNIHASYTWAADSNNTRKIIFTNKTITPTPDASAVWFFGDGTDGTGWNTSHEYSMPGRYYVCLRIQTNTSCRSYSCDSITVSSLSSCNIHASYTWAADSNNTRKIIFTNKTITPTPDASAIWFFGDGTDGTGWNTLHEYSMPGRYYVCLRVQVTTFCVSYYCDSVTADQSEPGCMEQSYFTFSHLSTDLQSYHFIPAFVNNNWQYTWTFGDGTGSHDINPTHRYLQSGSYTVCLTVFRNPNCASTTCKSLSAAVQPNCDSIRVTYNYQRDPVIVNKLYFYAIANNLLIDQTWTITKLPSTVGAPPEKLHENNPTYIFMDTGYYRVCLRAVTIGGCVKEYCRIIHIERSNATNGCILKTYPNPASTQVSLIVLLSQSQLINVYVYNSLNVVVKQKHQAGVTGSNVVTLSIEDLVAGSYYIKVIRGNDICYSRFQKL